MSTIQPRTLKGFRDFLPEEMRLRQKITQIFKEIFEQFGFEPLETPTLEYADILMGKYGQEAEKLIYHFTDRGGREVAMKYDLTVPVCRVLAQYPQQYILPFKRYQIQPVWRAENTQKGRFREFYQCDIDVFGSSSILGDAEVVQIGVEVFKKLDLPQAQAHINSRKIINVILSFFNVPNEQKESVCIAVDKLAKIGEEGVRAELQKKGVALESINKILELFASIPQKNSDALSFLRKKLQSITDAEEAIKDVELLFQYLSSSGISESSYVFDPTIIRGLSYYTGIICEFIIADGGVGSVAGGGRYDSLVGLYLGTPIPATGISFGFERIIEIIKAKGSLKTASKTKVLVTIFSPETVSYSVQYAHLLRANGHCVELYIDQSAKLEKQLKYANKKNIPFVIIAGPEEIEKKEVILKNMQTHEQKKMKLNEVTIS